MMFGNFHFLASARKAVHRYSSKGRIINSSGHYVLEKKDSNESTEPDDSRNHPNEGEYRVTTVATTTTTTRQRNTIGTQGYMGYSNEYDSSAAAAYDVSRNRGDNSKYRSQRHHRPYNQYSSTYYRTIRGIAGSSSGGGGRGTRTGSKIRCNRYFLYCGGFFLLLISAGIFLGRSLAYYMILIQNEVYVTAQIDKNNMSTHDLQLLFEQERNKIRTSWKDRTLNAILHAWLEKVDQDIVNNRASFAQKWVRPYFLPPFNQREGDNTNEEDRGAATTANNGIRAGTLRPSYKHHHHPAADVMIGRTDVDDFLKVRRLQAVAPPQGSTTTTTTISSSSSAAASTTTNTIHRSQRMKWQDKWDSIVQQGNGDASVKVAVDYTDPTKYVYPDLLDSVPSATEYPQFKPMKQLMKEWHQDEDYKGIIHETLMHFDYNDPKQLQVAKQFRDAEIPFKLINVPEILEANKLWTDDYLSEQFQKWADDATTTSSRDGIDPIGIIASTANNLNKPTAQEAPDNFFTFFVPSRWNVDRMGIPPTRTNDWDYKTWSQHAKYADAVKLAPHYPHFYWQATADREDYWYTDKTKWSFINRDLPSFSSRKETFFVFHPKEHKGIQCRFGERGIVAAMHYDGGRNSIAMITGAKRYILSPPRECSKLGIHTSHESPLYRHTQLNFAHLKYLESNHPVDTAGMSEEERLWLERAGNAESVETVLKAGEVLYVPSHWFHYIIGLQKNAQCNVRAGVDRIGHPIFGNQETVKQCVDYPIQSSSG